MKPLLARFPQPLLCLTGLCLVVASSFAAETNSASQTAAAQPQSSPEAGVSSQSAAPKLPYGVDDVLKLSRAQVSEDVVLSYIHNSGTIYSLGPQDIVYLRNQGVTDRIINAMLDQRKKVTEVAAQVAPTPAPSSAAPAIPNAPTVPDSAQVPAPPDYSQVAPQAVPAPSTVYVVPSPAVSYPYYYPYYGYYGPYGYYPYYYRGYYGPSVSFGFRFGGRGYGHRGWHHR
ncbi:MAG TPA: hypothetical protein VHI52_20970 [Verrucomicrobiae bacterium]|nr:hypothetical protein [Verrucomicrobiae bacterium]